MLEVADLQTPQNTPVLIQENLGFDILDKSLQMLIAIFQINRPRTIVIIIYPWESMPQFPLRAYLTDVTGHSAFRITY